MIIITAIGLIAAAGFLAAASMMTSQKSYDFAEDGYVLTMEASKEEGVVSQEIRFAQGGSWTMGRTSMADFRDTDGQDAQVPADAFVHYTDGSVSVLNDGAVSDLDDYLSGVISSTGIRPGQILASDGNGWTFNMNGEDRSLTNVLIKTSGYRFMLLSPSLTIHFADGSETNSQEGWLEVEFLEGTEKVVRMTNGTDSWQVMADGCTITAANGVTIACGERNVEVPESLNVSGAGVSVNLNNIQLENTTGTSTVFASAWNTVKQQLPVFNFNLVQGEDGQNGTDGLDGTDGEVGETGEDGQAGTEGAAGTDGATGATGAAGASGAQGTDGEHGDNSDDTVITGTPTILLNDWALDGTNLSFGVSYADASLRYVEPAVDQWSVSIYEVGSTGEAVEVWNSSNLTGFDTIPGEEEYTSNPLTFSTGKLKLDTEYRLVVRDTYSVNTANGSNSYTTNLLERTFRTDSSGIHLDVVGKEGSSGLILSLSSNQSEILEGNADAGIDAPILTFTDPDGNSFNVKLEKPADSSKTWEEYLKELHIDNDFLKANGISERFKANTEYTIKASLNVKTGTGDQAAISKKELTITASTGAQEPDIGGLTLEPYESGFLRADVTGPWDGNHAYGSYTAGEELVSITYRIYDLDNFKILKQNGLSSRQAVAAAEKTVQAGAGHTYADFTVDGTALKANTNYYVVAEYTWKDGDSTWTVPVKETRDGYIKDTENQLSSQKGSWAWDYANLSQENLITMSFTADGTGIYNNSDDKNEGITYAGIHGMLSVDLAKHKLMASDLKPMTLEVTGAPGYRKVLTYTECDGQKGVYSGTFTLDIDLDGLLEQHAYSFVLSGYLYDPTSGEYVEKEISTIVLKTESADSVKVGMARNDTGTGIKFALGDVNYEQAAQMKPEEVSSAGYLKYVPASYRNMSMLVFRLYPKTGVDDTLGDAIGEVYVSMEGDTGEAFPENSTLYQNYYGQNAPDSGTNTVGIGSEFRWQFVYTAYGAAAVTQGAVKAGTVMSLSDLEEYGYRYNTFLIGAQVAYDYTYQRFNYSRDLYDREHADGITDEALEALKAKEKYTYYENWSGVRNDYANILTVEMNPCTIYSSNRPTSPLVYQPNSAKPGIKTAKLYNNYGVASDESTYRTSVTNFNKSGTNENPLDRFDSSYETNEYIGVRLTTDYDISYTTSLTYYGFTNEAYEAASIDQTLDKMKESNLCKFKFTIGDYGHVETDNTVTPKYTKTEGGKTVTVTPEVWLLLYDSTDKDSSITKWIKAQETLAEVEGEKATYLRKCRDGDMGYTYLYHDMNAGTDYYTDPVTGNYIYVLYMDTALNQQDLIKRGYAYTFAMDSKLHYLNGNTFDFAWPKDYYTNGWVLVNNKVQSYDKESTIRSSAVDFERKEPQSHVKFISTEKNTYDGGVIDTWEVQLRDRHGAIYPSSLANVDSQGEKPASLLGGLLQVTANDYLPLDSNTFYMRIEAVKVGTDTKDVTITPAAALNKAGAGTLAYGGVTVTDLARLDQISKAVWEQLCGDTPVTVKVYNKTGRSVNYEWQGIYRLFQDKNLSSASQGDRRFTILKHNYVGGSFDFEEKYQFKEPDVLTDKNTIRVDMIAQEGQTFSNADFISNVYAIAITAKNKSKYEVAGTTYMDLYRWTRNSDGTLTNRTREYNHYKPSETSGTDGNRGSWYDDYMTIWISTFEDIKTTQTDPETGLEEEIITGKRFEFTLDDVVAACGGEYTPFKSKDHLEFTYTVYSADGTALNAEGARNKNYNGSHTDGGGSASQFPKDMWELYVEKQPDSSEYTSKVPGVVTYYQNRPDDEEIAKNPNSPWLTNESAEARYRRTTVDGKIPETTYLTWWNTDYNDREFLHLTGKHLSSFSMTVEPRRLALNDIQINAGTSKTAGYIKVSNYKDVSDDNRLVYVLYEYNRGQEPNRFYEHINMEPATIFDANGKYYIYDNSSGVDSWIWQQGLTEEEFAEALQGTYLTLSSANETKDQIPDADKTYYYYKNGNYLTYTGTPDFTFRSNAVRLVGVQLGGVGTIQQDGKDYFRFPGLKSGCSYLLQVYCLDHTLAGKSDVGAYKTTWTTEATGDNGTTFPALSIGQYNEATKCSKNGNYIKAGRDDQLAETIVARVKGSSEFYTFTTNRAVDSGYSAGDKLDDYDWTYDFTKDQQKCSGMINYSVATYPAGNIWTWQPERTDWFAKLFTMKEGADPSIRIESNNSLNGGSVSGNRTDMYLRLYMRNGFTEDDNTKLYFLLERSKDQRDWEIVISDDGIPLSEKELKETLGVSSILKVNNSADPNAAHTVRTWTYYGKDLTNYSADHTAVKTLDDMKIRFYSADSCIRPGYYYRAVALVLQQEDGNNTVLNIKKDDGTLAGISAPRYWDQYDGQDLVMASSIRGINILTYNLKVTNYGGVLIDKAYMIRLCKQHREDDGTIWYEPLDDAKYYSKIWRDGELRWENTTHSQEAKKEYNANGHRQILYAGYSYQLEFENLDPETTYRVQIYGFADRDYDNYIELGYVKDDGTYVSTIQSDKQEKEITVSDFYEGIYTEVTENTPDPSKTYYVKKDGVNIQLTAGTDYQVGDSITSDDNIRERDGNNNISPTIDTTYKDNKIYYKVLPAYQPLTGLTEFQSGTTYYTYTKGNAYYPKPKAGQYVGDQVWDGNFWQHPNSRFLLAQKYLYHGDTSYTDDRGNVHEGWFGQHWYEKWTIQNAEGKVGYTDLLTAWSSDVTTVAEGTRCLPGEFLSVDTDQANKLTLFVKDAFNMGIADRCEYTLLYGGTSIASGTLVKGNQASLFNDGGTDGNISLTLTNANFDFTNTGDYVLQVNYYDAADVISNVSYKITR